MVDEKEERVVVRGDTVKVKSELTRWLVKSINQDRAKRGLPPLAKKRSDLLPKPPKG